MTVATTTRQQRTLPAVTGSCRWHGAVTSELLGNGLAALEVTTATGTQTYWVQRVSKNGKVTGYRLSRWRTVGEGAATVYEADTSFGGGPEYHTCTCPDWRHRSRYREDRCCRHTKSLHAALTRVGLA